MALDAATGRRLWSYACEPYHGRTGSVATLLPADLDGDGGHEVVAGSDNWHYHGLSAQGRLLWRTTTVHASTVGCAGDCTGNGRDEIAAGTEYYCPRLLGPAGKTVGRLSGGPVTSAVAIFDLDGDGRGEAFFGMEDCFVRCLRGRRVAWKANVGGAPTAIEPLDTNGDGKPEIICGSESFSVHALRADGSALWRTQLSERVNDLAVVGARIVAACDDGRAYLLGRDGKVLGAASLAAPTTSVARIGHRTAALAAGRSAVVIRVGD
jgi:outer membrane protein assembly factor BamB